ncbi:hypothetical protein WOLCODRAFT_160851, partial [Wolfiporia cocos MD-104 SS10]
IPPLPPWKPSVPPRGGRYPTAGLIRHRPSQTAGRGSICPQGPGRAGFGRVVTHRSRF